MQALKNVVTKSIVPRFNFSNQLSASVLATIQGSIPILESQGQEVCDYFYKEIVYPTNLPYFNTANVRTGRQTTSLNQFLQLLAKRSDNLCSMNVHLNRISQKHAGFGLTPEVYPLFQEGIPQALKAVLKEKATPELLAAWTELLADVGKGLQENEQAIYTVQENTKGGWTGTRKFQVSKKESLGNGVVSLYLKSADGLPIMTFLGGQYITIKAQTNSGVQYRPLTICNSPGRDYYRVTIKPPGVVAEYLANVKVGEKLDILAPTGKFTLQGHFNDVVLIGNGIGTSSLFQIANAAKNRHVYYIQVAKNQNEVILNEAVDQLKLENPNFKSLTLLTDNKESLTKETLAKFAPLKNADFYFCGQETDFVKNVVNILKQSGVDSKHAFFEFDGPYQFFL